jgi:antitoxin HicB
MPMKKAHFRFNVVFRPEPEGGYTALVPALPGCVTYGRTLDESREMVKDAIRGYVESLKKHNEPIPSDEDTLVASMELEDSQTSRR